MARHTLSVLVQDQPGVLARISALFSRRGYNIESLAVGPTETAGISRMTIVTEVDESALEQITKQLNKLINVLKIVELDDLAAVERELMLIKVKADDHNRTAVLQLVELFRAKVVDVSADAVTVEATGSREKLEALCLGLQPYGIKEIVQSGVVALARGSRSIGDRAIRSTEKIG
ncbi:MAG: acetolactate synthase small subunit [Actinomycetales bacterium]|nr:acetolactate synthase small subunit [Actinomycetales bacterium]